MQTFELTGRVSVVTDDIDGAADAFYRLLQAQYPDCSVGGIRLCKSDDDLPTVEGDTD